MAVEYTTDIQCGIQSLINDKMMIELSLNKKTILLAYHHMKDTVVATVMIIPWIKTRQHFSVTLLKR